MDTYDFAISVIVPCYNVELYLKRCVDSIVSQTIGFEKIELILVNDASTDQTWTIIEEYCEQYKNHIIGMNLTSNVRQGGARNRGLEIARGKYIAFVDSDDWLEHDMYEKMLEKMEQYECDIVCCKKVRTKDEVSLNDNSKEQQDHLLIIDTKEKRDEFIVSNLMGITVWDKLYTREIIFQNNIRFVEKLAYEDMFWGAMFYLYANKVYLLDQEFYHYYVNMDSTTMKKNADYHSDLFTVNQLKWEEFQTRGALEIHRESLEYDFIVTNYIMGMKMLIYRYDNIPYDKILQLMNDTKQLIPDYINNTYVKRDAPEMYQLLVSLLDQSLSLEDLQEVCTLIRNIGL